MPGVWVVLPAFNEAENLRELLPQLGEVLARLSVEYHVVVVDDGSTDDVQECLEVAARALPTLQHLRLPRQRGKSRALQEGFTVAAEGGADVVVMMDADGQDDPQEIPALLAALDEGNDLVTGARLNRQDRLVKRTTSRLYNRATAVLTGAPGRDFNSGLKAMRPDVANDLSPMLYGELHRYITVIAHWLGYKVAEVPVAHRPRLHGSTKYGINRFWRGFIDLLTIRFLMSYEQRPSHLFGGLGMLSLLGGTAILGFLLVLKIQGEAIGGRPLLIAGVLLVVVGLQLFLFGLLAELIVYSRQQQTRQTR